LQRAGQQQLTVGAIRTDRKAFCVAKNRAIKLPLPLPPEERLN
jgi:hypothetical protein